MQVDVSSEERNWGMAAHLSALVAIAGLPFGHVLGPLVVYLIKGHESEFVASHAKASLNYQITMSILGIVAVLIFVAVGLGFFASMPSNMQSGEMAPGYAVAFAIFWGAVAIVVLGILLLSLIFIIAATLAASDGRRYNYPFAIRFLR